ncbi:MAG: M23 family metallopeptidase [Deltaproteobacteria bacterium]|jgi:biotin carboxyl carrier protein|nr:M23 family metallopeptidase [Deltaproteobacteria bacterium]
MTFFSNNLQPNLAETMVADKFWGAIRPAVLAAMFFSLLLAACGCRADFSPVTEQLPTPQISVLPQPLDRGSPARVLVRGLPPDCVVTGSFNGHPIFFFLQQSVFVGLFGADIMIAPGEHPLTVSFGRLSQTGQATVSVEVKDKSYGVRDIKVPQRQVDLSAEDLERAQREKALTDKALATVTAERLWSGEFLEPVSGTINSSFGRQTRLNGVLNARPHAGADYLVKEGTPIKAPADGKVVLTGDHFFSGKAIYIDHGQGLISMYFHLSQIDVTDGDDITKGQVIGLVGKTGRVTGAHLHYGIYINGARIDPPVFRQMTRNLIGSES